MNNDKQLISLYIQHRNQTKVAQILGVNYWVVGNRIRTLRKSGVQIPKFRPTRLTPGEVNQLNRMIGELVTSQPNEVPHGASSS